MTTLEERVLTGMGALSLAILTWIGQSLLSLEHSAQAREALLAENKVIVIQIKDDLTEIKSKQGENSEKLADMETRLSKAEDTIRYMAKKMGL